MKAIIGLLATVGTLTLAAASAPALATTIDTTSSWDGSTGIAAWGAQATQTYGETFTAPSSELDSFTFYVNDQGSPTSYVAEVYAWNGTLTGGSPAQGASGTPLYTSAEMTTSGDAAFDAITINTGGVILTPGQNYVIDLSAVGSAGAGSWGIDGYYSHPGVTYDGGFAFNNGPSSSPVWDNFEDFGSLAYKASFSSVAAVPETATWLMMILGFGAIGAVMRRAHRQSEERFTSQVRAIAAA
jgi:hypothetical protein